jgi:hypothetical protein
MQDHVSRVYGDVGVVLLQCLTGSKYFNDTKHRYPCASKRHD